MILQAVLISHFKCEFRVLWQFLQEGTRWFRVHEEDRPSAANQMSPLRSFAQSQVKLQSMPSESGPRAPQMLFLDGEWRRANRASYGSIEYSSATSSKHKS